MTNTFGHTGDLGDIIAGMPVMRALEGGSVVLSNNHAVINSGRENLHGARYEAIKPLLEAQPYISGVEWRDSLEGVTHDFSVFRHHERFGENIIDSQARHFGMQVDNTPWLTVTPSQKLKGRVVMARSQRYHSDWFPWREIAALVGDTALFVGMPSEHAEFEQTIGRSIEHVLTENLLELAEIIAGSKLFIGNQSCPFWIAAGLGVPIIQEVLPNIPNAIVVRNNAFYPMGTAEGRHLKIVLAEHLGLIAK